MGRVLESFSPCILIFTSLGEEDFRSNVSVTKQMFQISTLLLFVQNIHLHMNQNPVIIFQNKSEKMFYTFVVFTQNSVL